MRRIKNAPKAKVTGFSLTEQSLKEIDELMTFGNYMSRSEVIRHALHDFYKRSIPPNPSDNAPTA